DQHSAGRGAVALSQRIGVSEKQSTVDRGQLSNTNSLIEKDGAGVASVALPQPVGGGWSVGAEVQCPAHIRQAVVDAAVGAVVLDEDSAGGRPVALPQHPPIVDDAQIRGDKEQGAVDIGQLPEGKAAAARDNVLDQHGAGGAVALPQLRPVDAVIGDEVECPTDVGQLGTKEVSEGKGLG